MNAEIRGEVIDRVWEKLSNTTIDCPACASMGDDPQYTCEVCWCEGGNGTMALDNVIRRFTVHGDFE